MNDKIRISNYYVSLKKEISDKIKESINWIDINKDYYLFKYENIIFSKSKNNDDPNYCYLNTNINTEESNKIFETENCLIAFIIALCH